MSRESEGGVAIGGWSTFGISDSLRFGKAKVDGKQATYADGQKYLARASLAASSWRRSTCKMSLTCIAKLVIMRNPVTFQISQKTQKSCRTSARNR